MAMGSRELPACRTWALIDPPGVLREDRDDHAVFVAPARPGDAFSHRLVLDAQPTAAQVPAWLALWRERHAGSAPSEAVLLWEGRLPGSVALEAGASLIVRRVFLFDQALEPFEGAAVRPLGDADLRALEALGLDLGAPDFAWRAGALVARQAEGTAAVHGWFEDGVLLGVAALAWDEREARVAAWGVRGDRRRSGVGTAALTSVLSAYQGYSFGLAYAVVPPEGPAEAALRALGFRPVTWVTELVSPA